MTDESRAMRRKEQYDALEEMRASPDDETPTGEVLEQMRKTRRVLGAKR